jgi:flagellar biosynthesis/type III secretory pathway chaperone
MNEHLHNFIESLREELKQYGELLALLDLQQDQVLRRAADDILATTQTLNTQGEAIRVAREERIQRLRDLTGSLGLSDEVRIKAVLPSLAPAHRPLITALVEENNQLLVRVRQRARQNHILLHRSVELMEKLINSLCALSAPTYNETGGRAVSMASRHGLYEGIG